jgi:hypothetical protein
VSAPHTPPRARRECPSNADGPRLTRRAGFVYERRRPENGPLYRVVRDHLETLYAAVEDGFATASLPAFVRDEFERYLDCGILCRGAGLSPAEKDAITDDLRREVFSLWHTDEVRRSQPTPVDEARAGLELFEQILWNAVPAFLRELDAALREATGQGLPLDAAPIRIASWMGGDRDGNPNVTPRVTAEVCLLARWMGADLYRQDVEIADAPRTADEQS